MSTRLKIAIDAKDANALSAGKGRYALELIRALVVAAPEINWTFFVRHPNPDLPQGPHITQKVLNAPGPLYHLALLRTLNQNRPDHFLALTSYVVPAFYRGPTTLFVHDLVAFLFPEDHHRWAGFVERHTLGRALKNATEIACVSTHTESDLLQLFPIAREKPRVLAHPGLVSTLQAHSPTTPENYLLMVGTLEPRKNHRLIFEIFPELATHFSDLTLKIVGASGWNPHEVMKNFPENLKNRIKFCGRIDDPTLAGLYQNAQALLFPSIYEGFGMPVLEALALGCPVISSNRASLPEVTGDAALLCDPEKPQEWISAIEKLLSTPELRAELIEKGKTQAPKFSWQKSAKTILKSLHVQTFSSK